MKTVESERVEIPEVVRRSLAKVLDYLRIDNEEEDHYRASEDRGHIYEQIAVARAFLLRSLSDSENEDEGVCPECGRSDFFVVRDGRVFGVCVFHRVVWQTAISPVEPIDEYENEVRTLLVRDFREVEMAIPATLGARENMLAECQECGELSDWDTVGELCADCAAKC